MKKKLAVAFFLFSTLPGCVTSYQEMTCSELEVAREDLIWDFVDQETYRDCKQDSDCIFAQTISCDEVMSQKGADDALKYLSSKELENINSILDSKACVIEETDCLIKESLKCDKGQCTEYVK